MLKSRPSRTIATGILCIRLYTTRKLFRLIKNFDQRSRCSKNEQHEKTIGANVPNARLYGLLQVDFVFNPMDDFLFYSLIEIFDALVQKESVYPAPYDRACQ